MCMAGHDLIARGARPFDGGLVEITRYHIRRTLADGALRN